MVTEHMTYITSCFTVSHLVSAVNILVCAVSHLVSFVNILACAVSHLLLPLSSAEARHFGQSIRAARMAQSTMRDRARSAASAI